MVEVVAHDGDGLVEQLCDLGVGLALEELLEQFGVVAAAGGDELLLDGGALADAVSLSIPYVRSAGGGKVMCGMVVLRRARRRPCLAVKLLLGRERRWAEGKRIGGLVQRIPR